MDNFAHTLVGAALGRAVADRKVPGAALLGALAGNAPDWIAIVDPFFWIVPLVALAWGARRHWLPALGYVAALLGVTALVLWARRPLVAPWVRLAVLGGAVACVTGWVRHWFGVARRREAATYAMFVLAAYVAANAAVSVRVKAAVRDAGVRRFGREAQWAALPEVGHPF